MQDQSFGSIADEGFIRELASFLAEKIPAKANGEKYSFKPWTNAVYASLCEFAAQEGRGWKISPTERCYKDEYLCDFMLFEPGYGCRVACESQWKHSGHNHRADLEWAFDKLRGVKSDVKLFVFEGSDQEWRTVIDKYLLDYAQLSPSEAFIALKWDHDHFVKSWWTPTSAGLQHSPIEFQSF